MIDLRRVEDLDCEGDDRTAEDTARRAPGANASPWPTRERTQTVAADIFMPDVEVGADNSEANRGDRSGQAAGAGHFTWWSSVLSSASAGYRGDRVTFCSALPHRSLALAPAPPAVLVSRVLGRG